MTQALYAHMNNKTIIKKEKVIANLKKKRSGWGMFLMWRIGSL
jgi:hypothetical protein